MFSSRLKNEGINPPSIKLILLNRSTQYSQGTSKAFGAMFEDIKGRSKKLLEEEPKARGGDGEYFYDIPDTHSVAIVASHHGIPISQIEVGKYKVFEEKPMVNRKPLERYKLTISEVVVGL